MSRLAWLKKALRGGTAVVSGLALLLFKMPGIGSPQAQADDNTSTPDAEWPALPSADGEAAVEQALRDYLAQSGEDGLLGPLDYRLLAQADASPAEISTAGQLLEQTLGGPITEASPDQLAAAVASLVESLGVNVPPLGAFIVVIVNAGGSVEQINAVQTAYVAEVSEMVQAGLIPEDVAAELLAQAAGLPAEDIYG